MYGAISSPNSTCSNRNQKELFKLSHKTEETIKCSYFNSGTGTCTESYKGEREISLNQYFKLCDSCVKVSCFDKNSKDPTVVHIQFFRPSVLVTGIFLLNCNTSRIRF